MIDLSDAVSVVVLADWVYPQLLGNTVLRKDCGRNCIDYMVNQLYTLRRGNQIVIYPHRNTVMFSHVSPVPGISMPNHMFLFFFF